MLSRADPDYRTVARELDALVMSPIRALLGESRDVYISPDDQLNLVPFAALLDEDGRWLVSTHRFTWLTSGRDLLRLDQTRPARSGPVVVAGPSYDLRGRAVGRSPDPTTSTSNPAADDLATLRFSPLPGAAREGTALAGIVPGTRLLVADRATEAAIKSLRAPRLLHIATHGFFLASAPAAREGTRSAMLLEAMDDAGPRAVGKDPLLRAGWALAGANDRRTAGRADDGVLTALEASSLDLWGTKLVVLSACETGLGEVTNGAGVYGLRSALTMAGAESQVMSLWKVDDEATRLLMTDYYRRLKAGGGRSDALREAQIALMARSQYEHPFFWAAYFASGDQRSLEAREPPPVRAQDARR
jgi:CHAT domain-containing protein